MLTIILNGKKAGMPAVREAISTFRKEVDDVQVRVTYEYGDVKRFMLEALYNGVKRLIIGGSDGSVIKYTQSPWLESESEKIIPVNLDGEPYSSHRIRFEVLPSAIDLILAKDSLCLK